MEPSNPASRRPAATASPAGPAPTITALAVLAHAGAGATRPGSRRAWRRRTRTRGRDTSSHRLRADLAAPRIDDHAGLRQSLLRVKEGLDAVADRDHRRG